jgi:hypothetical protein
MGFGIERGIRNFLGMPNDQISAKKLVEIGETRVKNLTKEYNLFAQNLLAPEIQKLYSTPQAFGLSLSSNVSRCNVQERFDTRPYNKNDLQVIKSFNATIAKVGNIKNKDTNSTFERSKLLKILHEARHAAMEISGLKADISRYKANKPETMLNKDSKEAIDKQTKNAREELDHLRHLLGKKTIQPLKDVDHKKYDCNCSE